MNIIFLDIDGVLNGYNKYTYFIIDITEFLHIPRNFVSKKLNIFMPKEKYVKRLSKIVHKTNAKVVMSSSWRFGYWNTPYKKMFDDQRKLYDLLNKYNIEIIDITPNSKDGIRENEINQWLKETNIKVDNFVILDDESFDLQSFVGTNLVKTSKVVEGDMIKGLAYEDTGLKRKHIKQAIKILKGINNV